MILNIHLVLFILIILVPVGKEPKCLSKGSLWKGVLMCIIFDRDMNICDLFITKTIIEQSCVLFICFPYGICEVNKIKRLLFILSFNLLESD